MRRAIAAILLVITGLIAYRSLFGHRSASTTTSANVTTDTEQLDYGWPFVFRKVRTIHFRGDAWVNPNTILGMGSGLKRFQSKDGNDEFRGWLAETDITIKTARIPNQAMLLAVQETRDTHIKWQALSLNVILAVTALLIAALQLKKKSVLSPDAIRLLLQRLPSPGRFQWFLAEYQ